MMGRMPSSYGRSIAVAVFVFALTVSPYAHAAETSTSGINDPVADVVQLWTTVLSSIESLSQHLASVLQPPSSLSFNRSAQQPAPKNLPLAQAASAALATQALPDTATTSGTASGIPSTSQQPQSQNAPTATSDQTIHSPFVKSAALALPAVSATPASSASATAFVTQDQFNATFSNRFDPLIGIVGNLASLLPSLSGSSAATPQQVAGDGNNANPFAAASAINQLSNVTITNPNITGGNVTATSFSGLLAVGSGGTGVSTAPSYGQLLVGNSSGGYNLVATSSLGITTSGTIALDLAHANSWTGLQQFSNASTTIFSVYGPAYFGATATSSFNSAGALTLATALTVANGGTGATTQQGALNAIAPTPTRAGDIIYYNGSNWANVAGNNSGTQVLQETSGGIPSWAASGGGTNYLTNASSNTYLNTGTDLEAPQFTATSTTIASSFQEASTTLLSAYGPAYFGGTATSSFGTNGALSLVSNGLTVGTNQLIVSGGNVGIGTTTPGSLLSLNGIANFTSATSTFYSTGGINLTTGCFSIGGTCLSTPTSLLSNNNWWTGTQNFTNASTSQFTATSTVWFTSLTNALLSTDQNGKLVATTSIGTNLLTGTLGIGNGGTNATTQVTNGVNFYNGTSITSSSTLSFTSNGALGIGTSAPLGSLHIKTANDAGFVFTNNATNSWYMSFGNSGLIGEWFNGSTVTFGYNMNNVQILPVAASGGDTVVGGYSGGSTFNVNGNVSIGGNYYTVAAPPNGEIIQGNVGIGTTTPYSRLEVWGPDSAASTTAFLVANSASTTEFAVLDNGNATLAGNLIQNSDQRLKTNIQSLDASSSLAAIDALNPVTFNWIDPNKGPTPQLGFIAQQVLPIFPNLISTTSPTTLTPDGTLSLNYIDLISPIVSAIQALSSDITSIENTIAGFADSFTTKELTFNRATGNELDVQKLCVADGPTDQSPLCVTKAQLAAVLSQSASAGLANPSPAGTPSSFANSTPSGAAASSTPDTPPVIQINGENPAMITVGTTYNDLGATITGPQADLNLGITTFVNGAAMFTVQIDTTQAATDTIQYVAADSKGLTATSTRTVIIQPVAAAAAASTGSDAGNADASSTDATSTAR